MCLVRDCFKKFVYALDGEIKPKTLKWYQSHLSSFVNDFGEREITSITVEDLREWRHGQFHDQQRYANHPLRPAETRELSIFTKRGRIRAIKRFFSWLYQEGHLPRDPSERLKMPSKPKNREPKAITETAILELFEVAEHPRDIALLYVLEETGARVGGIVGLCLSDISEDGMVLTVTEKNEKTRQVYLTAAGAQALREWLAVRPTGSTQAVFISHKRKTPLTPSGIYQVLRDLAALTAVERSNPHSFRHAFARGMLNAGASLEAVSDMMGHSSVAITAESYAVWTCEEIRQKHLKFAEIRKQQRLER